MERKIKRNGKIKEKGNEVERNKEKWLSVENGKGNMKVVRQWEKRLSIK
jgi:hypothetical protein